jgi:hypothetical protein
VAKRRFRSDPDADKAPEDLSPEERRVRRRDERSRAARGKHQKVERTGWRRGIMPGVVAVVIVAVVLFLYFGVGVLFPHPCLAFQTIPTSSGIPDYPASNTTNFGQTWCPIATTLFSVHPQLAISINGQGVGLPPSIGRSQNFTHYECDLPIHTEPGVSGGVFNVTSPWPYEYTLGDFFSVWQESYVSAYVNATYHTTTIDYTSSQLLGLPTDATHTLKLFVDNQPSSAGPSLVLNGLDHSGGASPSCLSAVYGSNHVIALVYQTGGAGAVVGAPVHSTLATAPPQALPPVFGSALFVPVNAGTIEQSHGPAGPPTWLAIRVSS